MRHSLIVIVLGAWLGPSLLGQVTTARYEGVVQDESGAVVPGAKVEAVNIRTQVRAQTTTDGEGRFIFPSLAPSEYQVTVEAPGFRKAVRSAVTLNVGDTVSEVIKLEVGSVAESVVVEANAVRVQTADAQIARVITLRDIDSLPQLGRGPIILAIFNPGVQIDPSDATYSRVNGLRQGANNATLDGIAVNDPVAPRLGLSMTPNTSDTVEEFRVVTNGGKAEYGRNAGGQVQMITRSGTNALHGGAWDYLRNTKLNANNFFNNSSGQARPKYIRNIFGGRIDGPIRRDKTFFFGSYEGNRTRQEVVRNRTVLTPEAKQGVFRWRTTTASPIQSFDVVRNDPRGKGIDPMVKKLLDRLPNPNNYDLGDGLNTAGFRFNAPANSFNDQFTIKVDHNLWSGHRIFYRHSWMRTYSIDTTNSAEARFPGDENGRQGGRRAGWSFGSDWTITNTLVNELRFGGQKTNSDFLRPRLKEPMLVPNLYTSPIASPTDYSQGRKLPYTEITDNLTKVAGRHTVKGGVNVRLTTQYSWREDYAWPAVYLSRSFGNAPPSTIGPSGSVISSTDRIRFESYYNDMLGRMSDVLVRYYSDLEKYQPAGTGRNRTFKYREFALFLQDDWKVTRRLTLNAGLRYEFFGVPFEANGLQGYLDKRDQMNHVNKMVDLTIKKGGPYYNNDWNNFAPRLGFAWDVRGNGKTAIRGGWGVFYDRLINATLTPADSIPGFSTDVRAYPNQNPGSDVRASDGLPPLPQPTTIELQVPVNRQTSVTTMHPNLRTGYVLHTNLSIQREVFRNTVLEAGYVGTRGIKLFMHNNLNQPRIYEDFLDAFKQLQAFRASGAPVPAGNTLVRMFGTPQAAISAINATTLDSGSVGLAANNLDSTSTNYSRYAAAGLPQWYLRNYPQFSLAYLANNDGRSYYNSFQLSLRRQAGRFKFNANYTFSKSIDNWANEGNGTDNGSVIDWFNTRLNRGRSGFDKTHVFNSTFIYTLPFGKNRRYLGSAPRWLDYLAGGWDIGVLNVWQSGSVFSVSSGRATGPNHGANSWADYSGDRSIGKLDKRGDGVFFLTEQEKARFGFPEAGTIGTSGRNAFRGPQFFNIDTTLSKRFRVTESSAAVLRLEAYNLFNSARFGTPGASLATPASFGRFSGAIGGARIVQMALRFEF